MGPHNSRRSLLCFTVITSFVFVFSSYYNSMFDVVKLAGLNYPASLNETEKYNYVGDLAVHIQKLATTIAQSVYRQATDSSAPQNCTTNNVTVNSNLCFTIMIVIKRTNKNEIMLQR